MQSTGRSGPAGEAGSSVDPRVTVLESPGSGGADARVIPAVPLRPLQRPPVPFLVALDDDSETAGEIWRVRATPHVIGRTIGETKIPHDAAISARHAAIWRRVRHGRTVWDLEDLGSTNGIFVRVTRCVLRPGLVVLLGGRRYECESGTTIDASNRPIGTSAGPTGDGGIRRTVPLGDARPVDGRTTGLRLRELPGGVPGRAWDVPGIGGAIGRSPVCDIAIPDDPHLEPVAARCACATRGRLELVAEGAGNGLWMRVRNIELGAHARFLVGEQRFVWTLRLNGHFAAERFTEADRTP